MDGCEPAGEEEGFVAGEGPGEAGCGLVDCVEGDGGDDDEGGHEDCGGCWGAGGFFPDEVDGESRRLSISLCGSGYGGQGQKAGGDVPCW